MNKSDSIKELSTALAKFQAEIKNPKTTAKNPQFSSKYAPLDVILEAVRPILGKLGLSIIQNTGGDLENISISTMLLHSSGEWIETDSFKFKGEQMLKGGGTKLSIQGAGSCITYGRRYQVTAILGIAGNDDDDGNSANKGTKQEPEGEEVDNTAKQIINEDKIKAIRNLLKTSQTDEKQFLDYYQLDKLEEMTVEEWLKGMKSLEKKVAKLKTEGKQEKVEDLGI
jgi:hypothetical protein